MMTSAKLTKKLTLNTETLRALENGQLADIKGGAVGPGDVVKVLTKAFEPDAGYSWAIACCSLTGCR
jgi:hypothetical protein